MTNGIHLLFGSDGNRRYARKMGITFEESYQRGAVKTLDVVRWACCSPYDIDEISVSVINDYNFERDKEDLQVIAKALVDGVELIVDCAKECDFEARVVGDSNKLGVCYPGVVDAIAKIQNETDGGSKKVNFLVVYDTNQEYQNAVDRCKRKMLSLTWNNVMTNWSIPQVDLAFRPAQVQGFNRSSEYFPGMKNAFFYSFSNFFVDITKEDFDEMMRLYKEGEHRFKDQNLR
jgi:short-chain Z-isoprenyl diphosphate synthase